MSIARADAEGSWKPRRHHRHIGERFTDTWADAIVEAQEADKQTLRELQRQLQQEKRRADDEAAKRMAAEQQARAAALQQYSRSAYDDEALLSVRMLGADVTGPLVFALLLGSGWWAWSTNLVGRLTGRSGFGRKGRWVYDRSLGGKKIWVAESPEVGEGSLETGGMSDLDFDALAAVAAAKVPSASSTQQQSAAQYEPPAWWDRPGVLPVSSESERAARRAEAERILRRIEVSKNRGEDYALEDILALRTACMAAGGATLEARTIGARDAIYRAAIDAGIKACLAPGEVDLGDYSPLRLAAGVSSDLGLPERRAVGVVQGAVAGACRTRIVEGIATIEKGDDLGALMALSQLSSLLAGMPVLDSSSQEVALVAGELNSWASVASREKLLMLMVQIDEGHADLVARLMDLRPDEALPRIRKALDDTGGVGA